MFAPVHWLFSMVTLFDGLPLECCSSEIQEKSLKTGRNTPENAVYLQNHNTLQGEFCLRTGINTPEGDYPKLILSKTFLTRSGNDLAAVILPREEVWIVITVIVNFQKS